MLDGILSASDYEFAPKSNVFNRKKINLNKNCELSHCVPFQYTVRQYYFFL